MFVPLAIVSSHPTPTPPMHSHQHDCSFHCLTAGAVLIDSDDIAEEEERQSSSPVSAAAADFASVRHRAGYRQVVADVKSSFSYNYNNWDSGFYFHHLRANPTRFIYPQPSIVPFLRAARAAGVGLFLLTNSFAEYTELLMRAAVGPDWAGLFDHVVFRARKPQFFRLPRQPFRPTTFAEDTGARVLAGGIALSEQLQADVLYSHGNGPQMMRTLARHAAEGGGVVVDGEDSDNDEATYETAQQRRTRQWGPKTAARLSGRDVLYLGDNVKTDCHDAMEWMGWRTIAIVEETEAGATVSGRWGPYDVCDASLWGNESDTRVKSFWGSLDAQCTAWVPSVEALVASFAASDAAFAALAAVEARSNSAFSSARVASSAARSRLVALTSWETPAVSAVTLVALLMAWICVALDLVTAPGLLSHMVATPVFVAMARGVYLRAQVWWLARGQPTRAAAVRASLRRPFVVLPRPFRVEGWPGAERAVEWLQRAAAWEQPLWSLVTLVVLAVATATLPHLTVENLCLVGLCLAFTMPAVWRLYGESISQAAASFASAIPRHDIVHVKRD
jgi:hypothetical protein